MSDISTLQKAIEQFAYSNGKDVRRVFHDLLRFIVGTFNAQPEPDPTWRYTKEQNAEFHNMMCEWVKLMDNALKQRD